MGPESDSQTRWGIATPVNSNSSRSNSETHSHIGSIPTYGEVTRSHKVLTGPEKNANRVSIPVACVACRSKHLKCDGSNPCARCTLERVSCTYVKSRRGFKGPRRAKKDKADPLKISLERPVDQSSSYKKDPAESTVRLGDDFDSPQEGSISSPSKSLDTLSSPQGVAILAQQNNISHDGMSLYLDAYYQYFFPSHPFTLPKEQLLRHFATHRIPSLELAIQYVSSRFIEKADARPFKNALKQALLDNSPPRDGFTVQALLLLTIGLQAEDDQADANKALSLAIALALELGMNLANFALVNSGGKSVYIESWRRTYWQLYVVNGWLAGANPHSVFQLQDVLSDVPLPCEEVDYPRGVTAATKTFEDLDSAIFEETEISFTSFAYLISAVRALGKVLVATKAMYANDRTFSSADTELLNWKLHLPVSKRELTKENGQVDDVLFQAHMVVNAATIMLHRPNSPSLAFMTSQDVTKCVPSSRAYGPTPSVDTHMVKSMQSAEELSKLIRFPSPVKRRTPFFSCAIVMASIVHLSYWSFMVPDGQDDDIKGLIKLDIGALKSLGELWPIANSCVGQVRGVANELFKSKKALMIHSWGTFTSDEIFAGFLEGLDPSVLEAGMIPASGL